MEIFAPVLLQERLPICIKKKIKKKLDLSDVYFDNDRNIQEQALLRSENYGKIAINATQWGKRPLTLEKLKYFHCMSI